MAFAHKEQYNISDLLQIMELLRSPNGCPWDRVQTHRTIRKNLIEETYEAVEAIDREEPDMLCEELGDVLLQVVFHAQMEREAGRFDFDKVCDTICKKLIVRHPHIFADGLADTPEEVLHNWDQIKQREKHQSTATETLRSVAATLPALMRAEKLQKRAAKTGFDYPDVTGALADLKSELVELEEAMQQNSQEAVLEELGDLLFSVVNVARFLKVDPEEALTRSSDKFTDRFEKVEQIAGQKGTQMNQADMKELDSFWQEAKIKK